MGQADAVPDPHDVDSPSGVRLLAGPAQANRSRHGVHSERGVGPEETRMAREPSAALEFLSHEALASGGVLGCRIGERVPSPSTIVSAVWLPIVERVVSQNV